MSILRKIPKIEQVLDNMSIESLKRLESLMNSGNGATETYTLFGVENKLNYVNKDLGVWYCNIELERNKSVETGFLIWESTTKALFISYDITQCLKEYEIDLTNYTYTKINEKLSIEEFRRVLEDNINKEVVHIDTSGNVEVGKNLVVGGKVILNGKEDLVDTSGNVLISGSSGGGDIKNVVVNGEEFTWDVSQVNAETDKIINSSLFGIMNLVIMNGNNYGYSQINATYDEMGETISYYRLKFDGSVEYINTSLLIQKDNYQNNQCSIYIISSNGVKTVDFLTNPELPSDASTKTYTLKAVNGVLTWVEG